MVGTYGLPLVMVKGRFANVADMTVKNLEAFIPFMMKCSIHKEGRPNERPIWWPTVLPFRHTLQKPSSLTLAGYRQKLLKIVYSCYQCHGLQYLLKLSSDLSNLSTSCQKVSDGVEETTFIIPSFTDGCGRLLTLNNENLTYDCEVVEIKMEPKSPRRCLMPSNTRPAQVYLCENCDDEYSTRSAMTAHELQCYQTNKSKLRDPLELDEPVCQEPEQPKPPETTPQDLLGYLQLRSSSLPPIQSIKPSRVRTRLKMNKNVEFSSLLGRQILSCTTVKRDLVSRPEKLVQAYEAYCYVSARGPTKSREYEFRNYYKRTAANNMTALHTVQYCFSRAERYQRYLTLKTGLDQNSRKLLSQMKRCRVRLRRWVPPPTPPPAAPPLINLADDDDEMSSATTPAVAAGTAQADAISSSTTKRDAVTLDSEKSTLYNLLSEQSDQAKTLIGLRLLLKKGANGWDLNPAREKDPTTVAHRVIAEIDLISDEE